MGFLAGVLGFTLVIASGSAYYLLDSDDPTAAIVWPTEYNFKAEIIDVTNGRVSEYEVWSSSEHNRSRIDYYGGIKKTYYVDETEEDVAHVYLIYTKTDKNLENSIVCEEKSKPEDAPDYLPRVRKLKHAEETVLDGKIVQVWKGEVLMDDKKFTKTLYVYRTDYNFDVPVQEIQKSYEISKGTLKSYTITNYNAFGYIVSFEDVSVETESECIFEGVLGKDFVTDMKYLEPHVPGHIDTAFRSYTRHHKKFYEADQHEIRKRIFHENWKLVSEHNRKNLGSKLELNRFADYTDEEFQLYTGTRPSDPGDEGSIPFPHSLDELTLIAEELPDSFDMRLDGYMRPVRNQGSCGSCWAFTTAAAVEGALSRANGGRNLDLSEQSMVDCAWGYENLGCNGGELNKAFQYVLENGLPTEYEYGPYLTVDGICHLNNVSETFKIKGFSKVTTDNIVAMKTALYKYGPLGVAVYAGNKMKLYSSGILYDTDCDNPNADINHGVVVVGYGSRDGTPYWIIRNSWGETWGEGGYMLLSAINNNCHVMDTAYYAVA